MHRSERLMMITLHIFSHFFFSSSVCLLLVAFHDDWLLCCVHIALSFVASRQCSQLVICDLLARETSCHFRNGLPLHIFLHFVRYKIELFGVGDVIAPDKFEGNFCCIHMRRTFKLSFPEWNLWMWCMQSPMFVVSSENSGAVIFN